MLKQWNVKFWTKDMKMASIQVSAQCGLDARSIVEGFPDFKTLINYPQEVH